MAVPALTMPMRAAAPRARSMQADELGGLAVGDGDDDACAGLLDGDADAGAEGEARVCGGHGVLVEDGAAGGAAALMVGAVPAGFPNLFPARGVDGDGLGLGLGGAGGEQGGCESREKADGESGHPGPRAIAHESVMTVSAGNCKR